MHPVTGESTFVEGNEEDVARGREGALDVPNAASVPPPEEGRGLDGGWSGGRGDIPVPLDDPGFLDDGEWHDELVEGDDNYDITRDVERRSFAEVSLL